MSKLPLALEWAFRYLLIAAAVVFLAGCPSKNESTTTAAAPVVKVPGTALTASGVSFRLEGCRPDGATPYSPDGPYICDTSMYTTGNLGKSWNELDLVPFRLTARASASTEPTQQYTVAVVLDFQDGGFPGYDVLSAPVKNTSLSATSGCSDPVVSSPVTAPGLHSGIDVSVYRFVTITQANDTTCVYDFYGRLAIHSHLFGGSSLHANLLNEDLGSGGIGSKEVSIPTNDVLAQTIAKSMTATQGGTTAWNISKAAAPGTVSFGDVCTAGGPQPQNVKVTVTWTKAEIVPGGNIEASVSIYATNPAARPITISFADAIYQGPSDTQVGDALATHEVGPFVIPAWSTDTLVATDNFTLPDTAGAIGTYLSDEVTATYTDTVTDVPVTQTTRAIAQTAIAQGAPTDATASIGDTEGIDGGGLTFAVATPASGSFGGYNANTPTAGEVGWSSGTVASSGSVTFDKTIYLADPWITSGTLFDQAFLTRTDTQDVISSNTLNIPISSTATVKLTINKSIPEGFLLGTDTVDITFHITRAGDTTYSRDETITFTGGGATAKSLEITGLVPDTYYVTEQSVVYTPESYPPLDATEGMSQSVNLSVPSGHTDPFDQCTGAVTFTDVPDNLPGVQVKKTTYPVLASDDPDYSWTFRLTGPGGIDESLTIHADGAYTKFASELLREGIYSVSETAKTDWVNTSVSPGESGVCQFTVDFPANAGTLFSCDFVNTKNAHASVVKTLSGVALAPGGPSFTFELRQGASTTATGTVLETAVADGDNGGEFTFTSALAPAGTYQVCEIVMPGWQTDLGTLIPGAFLPPDGVTPNPDVDNSILCGNFTPTPGELVTFTVDNTPPPGGTARTIGFWKNWASCSKSKGHQDPVLDNTLATYPVAEFETYPGIYVGDLYVDTCTEAVALLNKSTVDTDKKAAKDPMFRLAAQLMAADLNIQVGAASCTAANSAITQAQTLLADYDFNGTTSHIDPTTDDVNILNSLATTLDLYNNNLLCGY